MAQTHTSGGFRVTSPENRTNVMMSNMKLSKNNYSMGMLKGNSFINKKRLMSTQRPKTNKN